MTEPKNPLRDFLDVNFDEDGKPLLMYLQWRKRLTPSEARWLLEVTQQYLEECPSEQDVLHERNEACGVDGCKICFDRDRRYRASRLPKRGFRRSSEQKSGYLFLMEVGGLHRFGVSQSVNQRIRSLQREVREPVTLVHSIKSSDCYGLEDYWMSHFVDFYDEESGFFKLSPAAMNKFRSYKHLEPSEVTPFRYFGDEV